MADDATVTHDASPNEARNREHQMFCGRPDHDTQTGLRQIARRYGPKGIRANAIAPGMVWHFKFDMTQMHEGVVDKARTRQMIKSRFGKPEDIAAMAALLLPDDGSFITGQSISVDGGVAFRP